jgi:hypothetical protein
MVGSSHFHRPLAPALQNDSLPTPRRILLVLLADLTDSPPSDRHLMGADWMWTSPKCTRLSEHKW